MPGLPRDLPHLKLLGRMRLLQYTNPRRGRNPGPHSRNFESHGRTLEASLQDALATARPRFDHQDVLDTTKGFYLEIELPVDQKRLVDRLENKPKKIELVAVRETNLGEALTATVFVPERGADFLLSRVRQYRREKTKKDKPKNEALVSAINTVRLASVASLFTDLPELFPIDGNEVWWEVWVRRGKAGEFRRLAEQFEIRVLEEQLEFPENEVLVAQASVEELERIVVNSGAIAELRVARDFPAAVLDLPVLKQAALADNLRERLRVTENYRDIAVCVLDSGANRGHVLLEPLLAEEDLHTYLPAWGVTDNGPWRGHGTGMTGISAYGDLAPLINSNEEVVISHCLESVKILPNIVGEYPHPNLYGAITRDGIFRPEIASPGRKRAYALAVTVEGVTSGKPSSWSSAIDELVYGDEENKRLIFVSAGNCHQNILRRDFPTRNDTEGVENPGQSWNAVTVGGYTEKSTILDPTLEQYIPISPQGDLCPTSRTSVSWERQWPIKPEVVLEAGNWGEDNFPPALPLEELRLLTTNYAPANGIFRSFGDTSCATALAGLMAAQLLVKGGAQWPETTRALIIHSAEWTPAMLAHFEAARAQSGKLLLLRRYGYGVPDLNRATLSTRDDVTLIIENSLQPFKKTKSTIKTRDMAVHLLPWPREVLQYEGEKRFRLKVTLSYFIEPNPGRKGWSRRHQYRSHGLRFALKRSTETLNEFEARMSSAIEQDDLGMAQMDTGNDEWFLGQARDVGSIHSDVWVGSGATLAQRDSIVVYPVAGWWKDNKSLERYNHGARYSLIVTISSEEEPLDIYTPITNLINIPIRI